MLIENERLVTQAVLAAVGQAQDARHVELLSALVRHLHEFIRETRLSEEELEFAFDFLNRIGKATNDSHNEAALFSDALGASTLVCLLNNGDGAATETAAALLGPFWRQNAPELENGASLLRSPTPGIPLLMRGIVQDQAGDPIAGVRVDVWQASPAGLYENQDAGQADMNLRGVFSTGADGLFHFESVRPAGYPVPMDGPTGDMLRKQNRQCYRPAHLHFLLFRSGYKTLITQVFPADDPHLEDDPVFGVTPGLIGGYAIENEGTEQERCVLDYRFTMQPGEARLPLPPIK